jgi:hypothetical protein
MIQNVFLITFLILSISFIQLKEVRDIYKQTKNQSLNPIHMFTLLLR